jgi:predicted amidohydrolase
MLTLPARPVYALERELVISSWQGPCADGDFAANLATVRDAIRLAEQRRSDFVVFPETFLSGYGNLEVLERGARRIDDPDVRALIAESAEHSMTVLVGIARRTDEGIFNTVLVFEGGKLLGTYDKCMLTGGDRDRMKFVAGRDVPVFESHGARFAVVICHDTSFPQPALLARLRGAEILFTPHYNSINPQTVDDHRKWVRNCHVGLACLMKMAVVRSNVVVTDMPNSPGYGDSFVMSPQGEILAGAELFRTELVTGTISPDMWKIPYVWADLDDVPEWMNEAVARELTGK